MEMRQLLVFILTDALQLYQLNQLSPKKTNVALYPGMSEFRVTWSTSWEVNSGGNLWVPGHLPFYTDENFLKNTWTYVRRCSGPVEGS